MLTHYWFWQARAMRLVLLVCCSIACAGADGVTALGGEWRWRAGSAAQMNRPAGDEELRLAEPGFDDSQWSAVRRADSGWYRRTFDVPASEREKHLRLRFLSAIGVTTVWLNGQLLGSYSGEGGGFEVDLTPYARVGGKNVLAVRSGGIRGDVVMVTTPRVYIARQRVIAKADGSAAVTVWVRNTLDNTTNVNAAVEVLDGDRVVARAQVDGTVPALITQQLETVVRVPHPELWWVNRPYLYRVRTVLTKNAEAVEEGYQTTAVTTVGIRSVEIRGLTLLLNGQAIRVAGLNVSDPDELTEAELKRMKESGMVLVVPGPRQMPESVLEWADANGMLLLEHAGNVDALRRLMERDFNHPSVIAWVVDSADLAAYAKAHDATRLVASASVAEADLRIGSSADAERRPGKPVLVTGVRRIEELDVLGERHDVAAVTLKAEAAKSGNLQDRLAPVVIRQIFQRNGNTVLELEGRGTFPRLPADEYEVRVGHQSQRVRLGPGERRTLEFELVNPYRVEVYTASGFLVLNR